MKIQQLIGQRSSNRGIFPAAATSLLIAVSSLFLSLSANAGSCAFTQENMFAGPFEACQSPIDKAGCEELGTEGSNANAVHSDGECTKDKLVGTCVRDDDSIAYYTGEADGLEIGCGFQGGEWE